MAENTPAENVKSDAELTDAQKEEIFNSLPDELKQAITNHNDGVRKHNQAIESIKSAESQDPKQIKAEIYEQNNEKGGANNKKLARLLEEENKLRERIEQIRKQAYEIIDTDGLMPKDLSEEEVEKLKAETAESLKSLKAAAETYANMEGMLPMYKGKLVMHLEEIKTRRGTGTRSSSGGTGTTRRPRFKKIEVNGVTQDDKGNTVYQMVDGNEKYTIGFLVDYLKKQHRAFKVTTKGIQDLYYAGEDENNLPDVKEFTIPYTYKNEAGNEHTVNYVVKAYR